MGDPMQVPKTIGEGRIEEAQELRDELIQKGEETARAVVSQPWVYALTRLGYAVRGFLYLLVGLLAVQVALGGRSAPEDQEGAIATIASQPYGKLLLIIILAARGTVLALVGLFLLQAAWFLDPAKVKDLDGALQALAQEQFGLLYLGVIAAGLIAYGSYSLLGAAWFRIKTT